MATKYTAIIFLFSQLICQSILGQSAIPDPDALVEKHIAAIGGRELYDAIHNGEIRFQESIPNGHSNKYRVLFAADERFQYSTQTSIDDRTYFRTLSRQTGWHHEIFKGKIMNVKKIAFVIEDYNTFSPTGIERFLYPKTEYRNSKTVGENKSDRNAVYEVLFELSDAKKVREFFDKESGLRVATWIESYRFKVDKENPVQIRKFQYEDYKKTEYGIAIPQIVRSNASSTHDAVYKVESAGFNLKIPSAEFEKPITGD